MTERRAQLLAWVGFGICVAAIPLAAYILSRTFTSPPAGTVVSVAVAFGGAQAFAAVGALIVAKHPGHAIGWLFALSGLATAVAVVLAVYADLALVAGSTLPAGGIAKGVGHVLLQTGIFLPLTLGLLLFPDGHLPSRRWWPAAAAPVVGLILRLVGERPELDAIGNAGVLVTIASALAALASLAVRWRRGGPELRQQLKWMAAASAFIVIAFAGVTVVDVLRPDLIKGDPTFLVFLVTYASVPIAAGTAILRYGLYEIDLIINRAIVYIGLTAILAGLYAGSTAMFQRLFIALTGQSSDAAIVITVALLATIFTPVRNALQRAVDARFKDARDLERLMAALEIEVESVLDVMVGERLAQRLLRAACDGADAPGAALFLDGRSNGRPAFTAGDWTGHAELVIPLHVRDREVGRMALDSRRHRAPYAERDRKRLQRTADVVAVGLALGREPAFAPMGGK